MCLSSADARKIRRNTKWHTSFLHFAEKNIDNASDNYGVCSSQSPTAHSFITRDVPKTDDNKSNNQGVNNTRPDTKNVQKKERKGRRAKKNKVWERATAKDPTKLSSEETYFFFQAEDGIRDTEL